MMLVSVELEEEIFAIRTEIVRTLRQQSADRLLDVEDHVREAAH